MDEQLDRLMSMTLPQVKVFDGTPVNHTDNSLFSIGGILAKFITPGVFALVGSNNKEILCQKKEAMTKLLDDCGRDVHRKNQENIAIVANALSSINEMVASKSDNGEDEVVKCIKDSSSLIQQTVTSIDETIQDTLDSIKDQIQIEYELKKSTLIDSFDPEYFGLEQSPVWSDFAAASSKLLQERAGAYLKGKTAENGEAIKVFLALFLSKFDSIEKSLEQVVVNMGKIQIKQEILKDRQAKLEGLIKKRNEIDRPKKLTRVACATIICSILQKKNKNDKVKFETIEKLLYRWDKMLEKGEKVPVEHYEDARNGTSISFTNWVNQSFIKYYKDKQTLRGLRKKLISSEAAFDEAALNQYKLMQSQPDDGEEEYEEEYENENDYENDHEND